MPPAESAEWAVDKLDVNAESAAMPSNIIDYRRARPGALAELSGRRDTTGNKAKNEQLVLHRTPRSGWLGAFLAGASVSVRC